MEKMTVDYAGGWKFISKVRGHEIISDLPPEKDGTDTGPTPPELLIASLGACIGVYANMFAERHKIDLSGMKVEMQWEQSENPRRISSIHAVLTIPDGIEPRMQEGILRSAEQCFVHTTIKHGPMIDIELKK